MRHKEVIELLENIKEDNVSINNDKRAIIEDIEAIDAAIEFLEKEELIESRQSTLNQILDEIVDEYFSDDTIENGYGLWEIIESVKANYIDEIETLEIA